MPKIQALIDALSEGARRRFVQELVEAAVLYQTSGDGSRLDQVMTSLHVTSSLHARQDYKAALAAAEAESADGPGVDVADFLSKLRVPGRS
jgi:hypothetical protein